MTREARPTVKLRPGKGRRLAEGAPWVFADEIAMDRRTRNLAPGSVVRLVDGACELGAAAFNPGSTIAARVLDPDPAAEIGRDWLAARLVRALALRERFYKAPFYRLVHAEGDGLPGLVVDRYGDALAVQPNAAWLEARLECLLDALAGVTAAGIAVVKATARARALEGLAERVEVVRGALEGPVSVPMNGATYMADLVGGQKTGLFYDQRPNHAFAAGLAADGRVLDLFCHVGGFGLAALAAGARRVLAVDSSVPALELAAAGAEASGVATRFEIRRGDAFEILEALAADRVRFDLVISDPPAFAPSKNALANGLRAYGRLARMAAGLVAPGGWLTLCSCSHAADAESFRRACVRGILKAGRTGALVHSGRAGPDHPAHIALPETSYLKALFFRLDG